RSTGTSKVSSTPTAPALATVWRYVTTGSTIASGGGTMNSRNASGNASRRRPRAPQRYPTSAAIARETRGGGGGRAGGGPVALARAEPADPRVRGGERDHRHEEAVLEVL